MMDISQAIGWEIYNIDPRDFGSSKVATIESLTNRTLPKYNQYKTKKSKSACTIVNSVKDFCYNYDYPFSDKLVEEAIDYCVANHWYIVGKGRQTNLAMQWVQKFFKSKGIDSAYIRISHTDPLLQEYKDAWYMIGCSFNWNIDYILDYARDWVLEWINFKPRQRGHRTSIYKNDYIRDSEYWFKYNEYKLKDLKALIKNWVYYPTFYVRVLPDNLTKPMEEIKKDDEREKELIICENSLSIAWKHLDSENQKKASELATYIRSIK